MLTFRTGRREKRLLIGFGAAGVLLALGGIFHVIRTSRQIPAGHDSPTLPCVREARSSRSENAFHELAEKVGKGELTGAEIQEFVRFVLQVQASSDPWYNSYGQFVEAAYAAGKVNPDDWELYCRQHLQVKLLASVGAMPKRMLRVNVQLLQRGGKYSGGSLAVAYKMTKLSIGGVDTDPGGMYDGGRSAGFSINSMGSRGGGVGDGQIPLYWPEVTGPSHAQIVAADLTFTVEGSPTQLHNFGTAPGGPNVSYNSQMKFTLTTAIDLPDGVGLSVAFSDPTLRDQMERCFHVVQVGLIPSKEKSSTSYSEDTAYCIFICDNPPVGVSCNVSLLALGGDSWGNWQGGGHLGTFTCRAHEKASFEGHCTVIHFTPGSAKLVLRPNLKIAGPGGIKQAWNEVIEFPVLEVKRGPATKPSTRATE